MRNNGKGIVLYGHSKTENTEDKFHATWIILELSDIKAAASYHDGMDDFSSGSISTSSGGASGMGITATFDASIDQVASVEVLIKRKGH